MSETAPRPASVPRPAEETLLPAPAPNPLGERLRARWVALVVAGGGLLVLALFARLGWPEAIGLGVLTLLAVLVPDLPDAAPLAAAMATDADGLPRGMGDVVDALAHPTFILDRRLLVLHRNPAAVAQFPNVLPQMPVSLSMRHPSLLGALEQALRGNWPQSFELHQSFPRESWQKVTVAVLPGEGPGTAGPLLVTLESTTEARRLDALRTDFIANASHELRTPLTSLVGFIDTLLGPAAKDTQARERFLRIMQQQAARMSKLIDDLLSLSRIEMRQHVAPTGIVELGTLIAEVTEGLGGQAAEVGMELAYARPPEPVRVTGDRDELYEVFENLIENAIKYGGDGTRVDITLGTADRPGFDWRATVTDHGPGIAPEHVPRLTERFYRVEAETSRRKKGTGLGLAIVKHILNRHQGEMSIRSTLGEGTTVEVLLRR